MSKCFVYLLVLSLVATSSAFAGEYNITRVPDGPFAFSMSGVELNKWSTLSRESILFNETSCPVQISKHSLSIDYKDRGYRFVGKMGFQVSVPVSAVQVRTILYDVFGQHMRNLSNSEPRDMSPGPFTIVAEWRALDNDISELLTTVTYVARVRLADGTQWVYNIDNLQLALSSLKLENKIEDDASVQK